MTPDPLAPVLVPAPSALVLRKLAEFDAYDSWGAPIRIVGKAELSASVEIEIRSRMPWTESLDIRYPGRITELSQTALGFTLGLRPILTIELHFAVEEVGVKTQVTPSVRILGIGQKVAGVRLKATFAHGASGTLRALQASYSKPTPSKTGHKASRR